MNARAVLQGLLTCLGASLLPACGGDQADFVPGPAGPPNVVLIVLDTLRADHLGCYGYGRDTSPRLDGLAKEATRYARSYSTAPWTLPSHASIFTGKHPFEHGARTYELTPNQLRSATNNVGPLGNDHVTIAETLSEAGYRTGAFVANTIYLSKRFRVHQGFDDYFVQRVPGPRITAFAQEWLDDSDGRPNFLFLNYMDTHRPYNTTGRADGRFDHAGTHSSGDLLNSLYDSVMKAGGPPPEATVEELIAQYDTAIANVDEAVGNLLDWMSERPDWENTLVIVTSDHGEFFGEHRLVEHSKDVYQGGIHVPLIVRAPGQAEGEVDDTPVSGVDIPALILSHLPDLGADYADRYPYRPGSHSVVTENYYSRIKDLRASYGQRFQRVRTAMIQGQWKWIHSTDGTRELFDLEADPDETRNLVAERGPLVEVLDRHLTEFQAGGRVSVDASAGEMSSSDIEELRALGYLEEEEGGH